MMKIKKIISALLIFGFTVVPEVHGHGYVMTPRSRQWVATEVCYDCISNYISIPFQRMMICMLVEQILFLQKKTPMYQ